MNIILIKITYASLHGGQTEYIIKSGLWHMFYSDTVSKFKTIKSYKVARQEKRIPQKKADIKWCFAETEGN
jgi:hypothetical protein